MSKELFEELDLTVAELRKENQELEKQLKDKTEDYRRMKDNFDSKVDVLTKIETQQKEFIKYLEDEIQKKKKKSPTLAAFIRNVVPLQQCLQKYKEIIGVLDEKK